MVAVNFWQSHPDEDNDDCYGGQDFDNIADAIKFYMTDPTDTSVQWIEIDLSDNLLKQYNIKRYRKNKNFVLPSITTEDDEWKRECATQAGMEFGVAGYNDYMGYDSEEYEP